MVSHNSSKKMNVTPSTRNWGTCGALGTMNCGNSAPKKRRAFGLLAPTKKPWAKRRALVDDSTLPETAISEAEEKSEVMPRYAR